MFSHFLLSVFAIPSGFFILIGFFALIVLAIALWKSPKENHENDEPLSQGSADQREGKE